MAKTLDGKLVAQAIYKELKEEVARLYDRGIIPRLSILKVGHDPASEYYVQNIQKRAKKIGMIVDVLSFEDSTPQHMIHNEIQRVNKDPRIHGIMIQMPLPRHYDEDELLLAIDSKKDIDGLHPTNIGKLVLGQNCFVPCTPAAVIELMHYYEIPTEGSNIVIIGRSSIVGLPLLNLLVQKKDGANATVTLCHSRTRNLKEIARKADVLVVAIGRPRFIDRTYVSKKSIIVDVGINEIHDTDTDSNIYVGDVNYSDVYPVVDAITPVPGGIGTITTASLLKNVIKASTE